MASFLVQAGAGLYKVNPSTGVATQITLPSTISLFGASTPIRASVFTAGANPAVICVNGGNHDFWIDWTGTARPLQVSAPVAAPVPTAGVGTGLNGIYGVACSFKVKDSNGVTMLESGLSPTAFTSSLVNKSIALNNLPVSADGYVNCRGIYRTLSGGTTLYPWFDIDDNITLSDDRAVADSSLSLLPTTATTYAMPPDLKLICSWKDRLWGIPRTKPDNFRWTEERTIYAWSTTNEGILPPKGRDTFGGTAWIPRRDDLGIAKRKRLYKIIGNGNNSFQRIGVSETLGCVSQESVVVVDNVAYMLSERGVVEWDDRGARLITENEVDPWFTQDTTFNRSKFSIAQGRHNPDTDAYELFLCSAGSNVIDRWVAFNLRSRVWYGPHKTDAFSPTACGTNSELKGVLNSSADVPITVVGGSNGFLYKRDGSNINDDTTAIAMRIDLPVLAGMEPDFEKFFDNPTIHTRAEGSGSLVITPTVGDLDAIQYGNPDPTMVHDLVLDRELLPILGNGRYCALTIQHQSTTEQPRLYGVEIPFFFIGRR
jgi:hypothetical protein